MTIENRFIKRKLHGTAKVSDDQILISHRKIEEQRDQIKKSRKTISSEMDSLGISPQAFSLRVKKLVSEGHIENTK